MIVILFIINIVGNASDQITDAYASVGVVWVILTVGVLYLGMVIQIDNAENKIKNTVIEGNYEIRTSTSVTLNDSGDTIKVDETKYLHILKKE